MPPVLVFINAPDSLSMKVDTVKLRIEIELRLRQNHIRVVEQSETRGKTVAVMTVVVETMAVNNDTEWMYVHEISFEELTQIPAGKRGEAVRPKSHPGRRRAIRSTSDRA
jgi:hypothetical protein